MSDSAPSVQFSDASREMAEQAQAEHDQQFGAMARKLAVATRLARLSDAYIKQLEAEVVRLRAELDGARLPPSFAQATGPLDTSLPDGGG